MTPHAEVPSTTAAHTSERADVLTQKDEGRERVTESDKPGSGQTKDHRSHLRSTPLDELHDLICIGFGPASLAIAIALHDALDAADSSGGLSQLRGRRPKVAFLERQPSFAWHSGMLLPGAKMQITFIKDLATLRDPRSEFTFLNYLHKQDRLVQFTNLSTFLPQRLEYEDYMRWCAGKFAEVVTYGQDVFDIAPNRSPAAEETVDMFTVKSRDMSTGQIIERRTKRVVVAIGGKPQIPQPLPEKHARVIHSAAYANTIPKLFPDTQSYRNFVVVGSGQSAAEVFHDLQCQYPNSTTRLVIKGSALRPSDDSPFVNEIFDPDRIDGFFNQSQTLRHDSIMEDRCTNYGVVRLELLEEIYAGLYTQRLKYPSQEQWPHRILNHSFVSGWKEKPDGSLLVHLQHERDQGQVCNGTKSENVLEADAVIVAVGYRRDGHEEMLKSSRYLLPNQDHTNSKFEVERDYKIKFREGAVADDTGIWLQGCNESTHGVSSKQGDT
ncbi:MAG: hypothetical protein M1820_009549 [Bogoriella megaspora]|nr:MAG: hypothetical protein M1820_009549 [Bogoriella megaspora]